MEHPFIHFWKCWRFMGGTQKATDAGWTMPGSTRVRKFMVKPERVEGEAVGVLFVTGRYLTSLWFYYGEDV